MLSPHLQQTLPLPSDPLSTSFLCNAIFTFTIFSEPLKKQRGSSLRGKPQFKDTMGVSTLRFCMMHCFPCRAPEKCAKDVLTFGLSPPKNKRQRTFANRKHSTHPHQKKTKKLAANRIVTTRICQKGPRDTSSPHQTRRGKAEGTAKADACLRPVGTVFHFPSRCLMWAEAGSDPIWHPAKFYAGSTRLFCT